MRYVLLAALVSLATVFLDRGQLFIGYVLAGFAIAVAIYILVEGARRANAVRLKPLVQKFVDGLPSGTRLETDAIRKRLKAAGGYGWLGGLEHALFALADEDRPSLIHFIHGHPPKDRNEWQRVTLA